MKIFQQFFKDNQKLNAKDIALEIENNKFQRLDKYIKRNIVYDQVLSTNQSNVVIPCDLLKDGGMYEFTFILTPNNESVESDYKLYFNNNNSLTYAINMFGATADLTASGNLVQRAVYRGFQTLIGDYCGSSLDKDYPSIFEGKIMLVDNLQTGGKRLFVETKYNRVHHGRQTMMFHNAISTSDITNITAINLTQSNTSTPNYGVGSRFILKRVL